MGWAFPTGGRGRKTQRLVSPTLCTTRSLAGHADTRPIVSIACSTRPALRIHPCLHSGISPPRPLSLDLRRFWPAAASCLKGFRPLLDVLETIGWHSYALASKRSSQALDFPASPPDLPLHGPAFRLCHSLLAAPAPESSLRVATRNGQSRQEQIPQPGERRSAGLALEDPEVPEHDEAMDIVQLETDRSLQRALRIADVLRGQHPVHVDP